jgi:hypothetical protein
MLDTNRLQPLNTGTETHQAGETRSWMVERMQSRFCWVDMPATALNWEYWEVETLQSQTSTVVARLSRAPDNREPR